MKTTFHSAAPTQTTRSCVGGATTACIVVASLLSMTASAQEELRFSEHADTSSPRSTLKSFVDSVNEIYAQIQERRYLEANSPEYSSHVARILDCLDTSELPEHAREELAGEAATCLKEILDRIQLPPYEEIPDINAIEAGGGLEKLTRWRVPGTRITLARVEEGPRRHEYLFSRGTVARAVDYYENVKSRPHRECFTALPGRVVLLVTHSTQRGRVQLWTGTPSLWMFIPAGPT